VRVWQRPWRVWQRRFAALTGEEAPGVQQHITCAGEVDRCPTCHLGTGRGDLAAEAIPLPFRAHGPDIGKHAPGRVGCTACHGGSGRALDPEAAHASPDGRARDPLMTAPHIQASCSRCHLPGERPGQERLLEGARLYAGLGCPGCHPLTEGGRGGWDYGPDLRATGRRKLDYLERSLLEPDANFKGSTMPAFGHALGKAPRALESLVIYLESLVLPSLTECKDKNEQRALVRAPCARCHAGVAGKASGLTGHRCPYLLERKDELRCAGCHASGIPARGAAKGYCPLVAQHRQACAVCHASRGD
jgi:hypothetical protein